MEFLGLKIPRPVLDGPPRPGIYLDSAATTLMAGPVNQVVQRYLSSGYYSNPHSGLTTPSRVTSDAIVEARMLLAQLVGAAEDQVVVFAGSGATEPLNIISAGLFCGCDEERDAVVLTEQEHHSNMLPWIRDAGRVIIAPTRNDGSLDLAELRSILAEHGRHVRAVTVTAISNVTGARNSLRDISILAHRVGAKLVVDASQAAAHVPISMRDLGIDCLVASGHKMYAPGSPGWMVIAKDMMPCDQWGAGNLGGGMVDSVAFDQITLKGNIVERLEGGTVNIPGIIGLGAAAKMLMDEGLAKLQADERTLMAHLREGLAGLDGIVIYGPPDGNGIVAFSVADMPCESVALALNNYFAISVRAGAFCAHPYVRKLGTTGLVRASIGMYTTIGDIDALVTALRWILDHKDSLRDETPAGSFSIEAEMER